MRLAPPTFLALDLGGLRRRQGVALAIYAAIMLTLLGVAALSLAAAADAYAAWGEAQERLRLVAARDGAPAASPAAASPTGALLTARTVGLAAASLQARVESAASAAGARTLSSRVDWQGAAEANGSLAYVGELELDPASLQPLLYGLEAGEPLMFVEDLAIRPLQAADPASRLRVALTLSAAWRQPQ